MNIGKIHPASFYQQNEHELSLTNSGSWFKCYSEYSIVGDISSSKAHIKPTKNSKYPGSYQKSSDDLNEISSTLCVDDSIVTNSGGLASNSVKTDEPMKSAAVKKKTKKKKKKKLSKKCSSNVVALGTAMANQTFPGPENSTKEGAAFMTGWSEHHQYTAPLSCQFIVGTGDSSHCEATPNYNSTWYQTNIDQEEIKPYSDNASMQSISSSSNPSGDAGLKGARNCDGKLFSEPSCDKKSDNLESYILVGDRDQSGSRLRGKTCEARKLNIIEDKVTSGCTTEGPSETFCFGSLSEKMFTGANRTVYLSSDLGISKGANEAARDGGSDGVKFNLCSGASDIHDVSANKCIEEDRKRSNVPQVLSSHMPRHLRNRKQTRKENSNLIWQKSCKNIGEVQTPGRKKCIHDYTWKSAGSPETILLAEHDFSTGQTGLAENFEDFGVSLQQMDRDRGHVIVESSWSVARQKFLDKISQNTSISSENGAVGSEEGKPKEKLNQSCKHEKTNNRRKEFWVTKARPCGSKTRPNRFEKETIEVPSTKDARSSSMSGQRITHDNQCHKCYPSETRDLGSLTSGSASSETPSSLKIISCHQNLLDEVQPQPGGIPKTEQAVSNTVIYSSLDGEEKNPACLKTNHIGQETTSRVSSQSQVLAGGIDIVSTSITRKTETFEESHSSFDCEAPSVLGISSEMAFSDGFANTGGVNWSRESRKDYAAFDPTTKDTSICISSQMAVQTLNASYRLQLASESVQFATGSPIAEFEKLLYSATPVIVPSFIQKNCNAFSRNQIIPNFLCRHQVPNVSLGGVWRWYEEPGNYGLEVEAEASQNLKGSATDVVQFHAYFIPSLSAVQLFGHSYRSKHGSSPRNLNTEVPEEGQDGNCSFPSASLNPSHPEDAPPNNYEAEEMVVLGLLNSVEKHTSPLSFHAFDGNCCSNLTPTLACSDDSELVFEYFEQERPEKRKPLYAKIKELVNVGTSNHQVYGDPSKLECMNLHDLHPASWYSVAWYPIYRIPEGSLRASFLTYHSLGHLVQRCIRADSVEVAAFCVVSPVLGMQSYNALGECWFTPKNAVASFSKDDIPCNNSSEILEERLRALEETASMYARGNVYKGTVKVSNRQSDYEFFLSRKK